MKARILPILAVLVAALTFAAPAGAAKTRFTVRGAGFGHGVGMSQWGAYGYATHGWGYREILAHYYSDTAIGATASRTVRVLLQGSTAVSHFSGASAAGG